MTSEELHELIQDADTNPNRATIVRILNILERMNGNVLALERRLDKMDKQAARTSNIASCLANGILPD